MAGELAVVDAEACANRQCARSNDTRHVGSDIPTTPVNQFKIIFEPEADGGIGVRRPPMYQEMSANRARHSSMTPIAVRR